MPGKLGREDRFRKERNMRLGNWAFAFIIAFSPFFCTTKFFSCQSGPDDSTSLAVAAELTDTEIGQFRKLMEERADEAKPIPGQMTKDETATLRGLLEQFEGISYGGFVENFFQYESVHPGGRDNSAIPPKVFDRQVDSFTVNNIEMWLMKEATDPGDIGF